MLSSEKVIYLLVIFSRQFLLIDSLTNLHVNSTSNHFSGLPPKPLVLDQHLPKMLLDVVRK